MKKLIATLALTAIMALSGCGTMKAMTDLGQAAFNDMGMVVEGAQSRMVQEYQEN